MRARRKAERDLARSRQRFEARLARVRSSLGRELGSEPARTAWTVPVLAFAGGMAAAVALVGRLRTRRRALEAHQDRAPEARQDEPDDARGETESSA